MSKATTPSIISEILTKQSIALAYRKGVIVPYPRAQGPNLETRGGSLDMNLARTPSVGVDLVNPLEAALEGGRGYPSRSRTRWSCFRQAHACSPVCLPPTSSPGADGDITPWTLEHRVRTWNNMVGDTLALVPVCYSMV